MLMKLGIARKFSRATLAGMLSSSHELIVMLF